MGTTKAETINYYMADEMRVLKRIVRRMIAKYSEKTFSQKDEDDFFSLAALTLFKATESYDESKNDNFDAFFKGCLHRKFTSMLRDSNREMRRARVEYVDSDGITHIEYLQDVSLDAPVTEDGITLGETIPAKDTGTGYSEELLDYWDSLTDFQRIIIQSIADGYKEFEVREMMEKEYGVTPKQFTDLLNDARSIKKTRHLISKYVHIGDFDDGISVCWEVEE